MSFKKQARQGQAVMLLEPPFEGVEGTVRFVHGNGAVSIVIHQADVPKEAKPVIVAPDKYVHWTALPGEFEIKEDIKGVF